MGSNYGTIAQILSRAKCHIFCILYSRLRTIDLNDECYQNEIESSKLLCPFVYTLTTTDNAQIRIYISNKNSWQIKDSLRSESRLLLNCRNKREKDQMMILHRWVLLQITLRYLFIMCAKKLVEPRVYVAIVIESGWVVDDAAAERRRTCLQGGYLQLRVCFVLSVVSVD